MTVKQKVENALHKGRIEWAKEEQKNYELGKNLEKSYTHIFLSTPKKNEYTKVYEIINKYSIRHSLEFDTIFKIYKLQNYYLPLKIFKGTNYKYKSISTFKSIITRYTNKKLTKNDEIKFSTIISFLDEIMPISVPFPLVYDDIKNKKTYDVFSLLKSGVLTKEEKDFILSEIQPRKEKIRRKEKTMKRVRTMFTQNEKNLLYSTIVQNYNEGSTIVSKLLKKQLKKPCNIKTIQNYILTCKRLEKGLVPQKTMPKSLIQLWKNTFNSTTEIKNNTELEGTQYFVIQDNKVILSSTNKEYLKGFKDCAKVNNISNNWKIYEVRLVED